MLAIASSKVLAPLIMLILKTSAKAFSSVGPHVETNLSAPVEAWVMADTSGVANGAAILLVYLLQITLKHVLDLLIQKKLRNEGAVVNKHVDVLKRHHAQKRFHVEFLFIKKMLKKTMLTKSIM